MRKAGTRSRGFTLTELLVVVLIIAALAAIAVPVARAVQAKSRMAACLSNLNQIGVALESYLQDHGDTMPELAPGRKSKLEEVPVLETEFASYLPNEESFHCPADSEVFKKSGSSYLWNSTQSGRKRNQLEFFGKSGNDERIPLVTDKEDWHSGKNGTNFLYADLSASNKVKFDVNR